ncbi:MAG: bifunctional enoyl-CoA hydratase/phosphate acetyltransferase [Hyphomicrobiaceae bacterium]
MFTTDQPAVVPRALIEKAQVHPPVRTAVVNAVNDVVMESVRDAVAERLIEPVLIGARQAVATEAAKLGFDISDFEIVDAEGEEFSAAAGAKLAAGGEVGAVMKGHLHTDIYMRALLSRDAGLRTGAPFTHLFYMTLPGHDDGLVITDAALNPAPDVETRMAITRNAVSMMHALGVVRPKVALLSASEVPNPRIPSSEEAAEIAAWAKDNVADADVDGPLAFDLAVSPEAVAIKGVTSPVAGRAEVIVVPEIVAGNALFKMMVQFMGACAGGLVMGAKVPILLTSRADPPVARLASAALASVASSVARQAETSA